jgi:hypothetical protein
VEAWVVLTTNRVLLILAVVLQFVVFLAELVPFALPRLDAWQAAALLAFIASFIF